MKWHSPYQVPETKTANARVVLVWAERIDNPAEFNAPGRLSFGHCIPNPDSKHWPEGGWFIHGIHGGYKVSAWAYADPPSEDILRGIRG